MGECLIKLNKPNGNTRQKWPLCVPYLPRRSSPGISHTRYILASTPFHLLPCSWGHEMQRSQKRTMLWNKALYESLLPWSLHKPSISYRGPWFPESSPPWNSLSWVLIWCCPSKGIVEYYPTHIEGIRDEKMRYIRATRLEHRDKTCEHPLTERMKLNQKQLRDRQSSYHSVYAIQARYSLADTPRNKFRDPLSTTATKDDTWWWYYSRRPRYDWPSRLEDIQKVSVIAVTCGEDQILSALIRFDFPDTWHTKLWYVPKPLSLEGMRMQKLHLQWTNGYLEPGLPARAYFNT